MAKTPAKQEQRSNLERLKHALDADTVQTQFRNALTENSGPFVASLIDLYGSDTYLQQCDPGQVIMEALKAATLKLPINKQLGFAYIVPYKKSGGQQIPQFQLGYKGYVQLAMRSGQYRTLNADMLYEGEEVEFDRLSGRLRVTGERTTDKVIGYFAYEELLNGFQKTLYMTKAEVTAWAKRYSKSYAAKTSAWKTNFDEMGLKTTVRRLLSKWGILSIEMISVITAEQDTETEVAAEIGANANAKVIDLTPEAEPKDDRAPTASEVNPDPDADLPFEEPAKAQAEPGY